ncbi:MAG: hypothetical protein IAE82_18165 [Opitutaceae bacterium]|nr:hypothetical protein [Opitutaceae bacterium]
MNLFHFAQRITRLDGRALALVATLALGWMPDASAAQFTLTWSDNSTNETGFRIERAAGLSATSGFAEIATVGANTTSFVDAGLPNSAPYSYRLRAYNSAGNSGYSNVATGTTPAVASNSAPTLSNIADQTLSAGSSTGAISFSVSDIETAATSLVVSRSSSNTTLIPVANIVLGGSGSSRTVTITPAAGQSGTATITITVSDGQLSSSDTFNVTVAPASGSTIVTAASGWMNTAVSPVQTGAFTASIDVTPSANNLDAVIGFSPATVSGYTQVAAMVRFTNTGSVDVRNGGTYSAAQAVSYTSGRTYRLRFVINVASRTYSVYLTPSGGSEVQLASDYAFRSEQASATSLGNWCARTTTATGSITIGSMSITTAPVNTAPTISNLADRTINEDGSTGAIAFSIGDAQTAAASLTVTATSSNTAVVPAGNIVLGGSGASRTVTMTPAANASGTSTITVRVSDGSLSATDTFVLTVAAVNDAPTISNVADRTIDQDATTGTIPFTVGDIETSAGSLTVSATSSNSTLVPASAIVLGGSGASRTITLTPANGQSGTATITVTVSDGSLVASDSLVLTVRAVNTAPTISAIADKSIAMNGTSGAIAFTIGDAETAASSLTLTASASNTALTPLQNIVLGGSGANRTVTVTPAASSTGTSTITIEVSDGSLTQMSTFDITVATALTYEDIGGPAIVGSHTETASAIQIRAGGTGITGSSDQFHFGRLSVTGDSEMTVRVASLSSSGSTAKAGLMYRASTFRRAANVYVCVTAGGRIVLQYRQSSGATTRQKYYTTGTAPRWLKITRMGDTFYAFHSTDGSTWVLLDFITVDLPDAALAGLAVTSGNKSTAATATFDGLSLD